jgi:methyl-accepting chemotaxis protein
MTIRTKLIAFAGFAVAVGVVVGITAYWGLGQVETARAITERNAAALRHQMTADMMHDALRGDVLGSLLAAERRDATEQARLAQGAAEHGKTLQASMAGLRELVVSRDLREAFAALEPVLAAYVKQAGEVVSRAARDREGALAAYPGFATAFTAVETQMEQVSDRIEAASTAAEREGQASVQLTRRLMAGIILASMLLLGIASVLIIRAVVPPLRETAALVNDIADGEGDLTRRLVVRNEDEIGGLAEGFNRFVQTMHDIIAQSQEVVTNVAAAARQTSAAAAQLSSGAQEQAASLEQTAASLEQITGTVQQNADSAQQANQLAGGSRDTAEEGGRVVSEAVGAMQAIHDASKKIADIIATIDEIAFQTNLLALNAAVEAARAGEQGRGFAVVAAEVRNLAQRAATAAREIKGLILDSVGKVEAGSRFVSRSGETLDRIVVAVKQVTGIVAEIAAASQEQARGIEQVNRAVTQMDQVVQSNAAQTEELSSTARGLSAGAEQLQALIGRFRLSTSVGPAGAVVAVAAGPVAGGVPVRPGVPARRPGYELPARASNRPERSAQA